MSDPIDDIANNDENADNPPVAPAPTPGADLKAVADSIKAAILESRTVAAPVAPPAFDNSATRRALEEESIRVNEQINELANSGKYGDAMNLRDQFVQKANRLLAQPEGDNEIVKTAVIIGERLARVENKAIMDRYGDEVKAVVDAMPANERIKPNAWDKAIKAVRADHMQEMIDEQVNAKVSEARKSFVPPPMPGARARATTGAAAKLNEEQLWGADICGVDAETYAKEVERERAFDALPFKERGPFGGYPLVSDKVTPGGF